jgi:hypothetical protein
MMIAGGHAERCYFGAEPFRLMKATARMKERLAQSNHEAQEHEEKYLESGYRSQLHHLPVLFKSLDG